MPDGSYPPTIPSPKGGPSRAQPTSPTGSQIRGTDRSAYDGGRARYARGLADRGNSGDPVSPAQRQQQGQQGQQGKQGQQGQNVQQNQQGQQPPLSESEIKEALLEDHARANTKLLLQAEQGPRLVRLLAFLGGLASCWFALVSFISHTRVVSMLAAYQVCFAVTGMIFEISVETLQRISFLSRFYDTLKDKVACMTDLLNRGVFYIFQGSLWLSLCWALRVRGPYCFVGCYLVASGALCAFAHYGRCGRVVSKVGEEAQLALGPPVGGRTFNTQELAERRTAAAQYQEQQAQAQTKRAVPGLQR
mmetsp:Transcript_15467/g.41747  ORF Transcript_15467/g.41747 Transcript_15467/m.41747 type:complete len:305 (+) Transcript_15467:56-970(+)